MNRYKLTITFNSGKVDTYEVSLSCSFVTAFLNAQKDKARFLYLKLDNGKFLWVSLSEIASLEAQELEAITKAQRPTEPDNYYGPNDYDQGF